MRKRVVVEMTVDVEFDPAKFTPDFMAEYQIGMGPIDTVDGHIENLARLYARGLIDSPRDFVEGYGPLPDMGITFHDVDLRTEIDSLGELSS